MPQARPRAPITVRISVTGHRRLAHADRLTRSVCCVLARLDAMLRHTPHTYVVVSPLAEGADRLVSQAILDWPVQDGLPAPALHVSLPLPEADYAQDFETAASRDQFEALLARASERFVLGPAPTRSAAYEAAGRHVVRECDLLIAIWDGRPTRGQGSTAEIVAYARRIGRTVFVIDAASGEVTVQRGTDASLECLEQLEARNREADG
jgi:hypothetical protein